MLRPYIFHGPPNISPSCFANNWSRPVSFPPGRVIANVPAHTIQIITISDDLIEIVPLPDPANPSAAQGVDPRCDR